MTRITRRAVVGFCMAVLLLSLAGCAPRQRYPVYWVDGTRGCKEAEHVVALWSAPGAANADAQIVGTVPHGTALRPTEISSAFGVRYYRTSWDGLEGWLPGNYVKKYAPICE